MAFWAFASHGLGYRVEGVVPGYAKIEYGTNFVIYLLREECLSIVQTVHTPRCVTTAGDLIPWTMAQQFQDDNFPQLSGARVVR